MRCRFPRAEPGPGLQSSADAFAAVNTCSFFPLAQIHPVNHTSWIRRLCAPALVISAAAHLSLQCFLSSSATEAETYFLKLGRDLIGTTAAVLSREESRSGLSPGPSHPRLPSPRLHPASALLVPHPLFQTNLLFLYKRSPKPSPCSFVHCFTPSWLVADTSPCS